MEEALTKTALAAREAKTPVIPPHIKNDRYWRGLIHLFTEHGKLNRLFTTEYIDTNAERVHIDKLRRASKGWSTSEKFMLNLALHLYNDRNKVNFCDMQHLDHNNRRLALQALEKKWL